MSVRLRNLRKIFQLFFLHIPRDSRIFVELIGKKLCNRDPSHAFRIMPKWLFMPLQNSEFIVLRSQLTEFLQKRHFRKTPERYAILSKAVELSAHFDVDQLYNALETEGYHVSRATVYNTLELLCEAGILNRHLFAPNQARYEVARGSHLHLICRRCGKIREIDDPEITERLVKQHYPDFTPEYSSSSVYGLCDDCRSLTDS